MLTNSERIKLIYHSKINKINLDLTKMKKLQLEKKHFDKKNIKTYWVMKIKLKLSTKILQK
jgi:hypothetical protein